MKPKRWKTIKRTEPGLTRRTLWIFSVGFFALLVATLGLTQDNERRTHSSTLVTTEDAELLNGAELYYQKCSVCHGDTGLGLEEARATFPEDHRRCTQCHKSGNPKEVDWLNIRDNDMFDIGDPTPLRGEGALANFANPESLQAYISATMPRYAPNSLEADDYRDIAAFLLHINNVQEAGN